MLDQAAKLIWGANLPGVPGGFRLSEITTPYGQAFFVLFGDSKVPTHHRRGRGSQSIIIMTNNFITKSDTVLSFTRIISFLVTR